MPHPRRHYDHRPSSLDLAGVELELAGAPGREVLLREKLQEDPLPLDYLLGEADFKEAFFNYEGQSSINLHIDFQGDVIWGATARILKNFLDILCESS